MEIIEQKRHFEKELPLAAYCEKHGLFSECPETMVKTSDILPENGRHPFEFIVYCLECKLEGTFRICKRIL